jgi:transposase InsO family protein
VGLRTEILIRDNDRAYGAAFTARVRAMGIRDRPTSFRSPWQNGYVGRLIGSIRRECTDHLIVFNAAHLRRILTKYAATHVSLGKDAPCTRMIEQFGDIVSCPILGGLHHRYTRIQFSEATTDSVRGASSNGVPTATGAIADGRWPDGMAQK